MKFLIAIILSYLIGSIPFAYIFSRLFFRIDLRKQGTGNIGTFNFIRVTRNKGLGFLVLFLDMAKGYLGVALIVKLIEPSMLPIAAIALILGHNYPIWLKFRGGRGLATLGGIMLFVNPWIIILWGGMFGIFYLILKNHIFATVLSLILINALVPFLFPLKLLFVSIPTTFIVILKYVKRVKSELKEKGVPNGA